MIVHKERKAAHMLAFTAALIAVLFFGAGSAKAASRLALFHFAAADDRKPAQGAKVGLEGNTGASSWKPDNPNVVKVSKKGIATAGKPVTWVMDDGLLLYGTGFCWYA